MPRTIVTITLLILVALTCSGCDWLTGGPVPEGKYMSDVDQANWRCEKRGGIKQTADNIDGRITAVTCNDGRAVKVDDYPDLIMQKDGRVVTEDGRTQKT